MNKALEPTPVVTAPAHMSASAHVPKFVHASNTSCTFKGPQTGRKYQLSNIILYYKYIKPEIMKQFNDQKPYTIHLSKRGKKYCSLQDLLSYCSDYYCSTLKRQCFHRWDKIFNQLIKSDVSSFNLYLVFNKKMYCVRYHSTGKFSTVEDHETTFNSPHVVFRSVITKSEQEDDEEAEEEEDKEARVVRKASKRKARAKKVEMEEDDVEEEEEWDEHSDSHVRLSKKRNIVAATDASASASTSASGDFTHMSKRPKTMRNDKILIIGDLVCIKDEFKKLLRKNIINLQKFVSKCDIMYYTSCDGRPDSSGYIHYLLKCYKLKFIGSIGHSVVKYKFEIDYDSEVTNLQYTDLCNFTETCDTFGKICSAEVVSETDVIVSF